MRKLTSLLLSIFLVFTLATGVQAQQASHVVNETISISINGEQVQFNEQQPYVEKGTTLVPARAIFETLDYNVSWDQENQIVVAEKYGVQLALQIGNSNAYANGVEVPLTVAPKVVKGTTYVPLRFISEAIGFTVDWHGPTRAVSLTKVPSKGYIWKVEKDGNVAYVAGSIHVGDAKMYPLRDEIEQAFDSSDHLVVEINVLQLPDEQITQQLTAIASYSDGTTLKDHVSAETYALVQRFLTDIGADPTAFDPFKAWNVQQAVENIMASANGYQAGSGVDQYFLNRALLADKPILELESYTLQYKAFDSYSEEFQEELLAATLNAIYGINQDSVEVEESEANVVDLANLWISGNDENLELLTATLEKEAPEMYENLIVKRHVGMMEKIEGYLSNEKKETYFVVVGYLHLLGKDGLITQLKEKGYTVTRI